MKVKNTLELDLIYSTLRDKMLNLISDRIEHDDVYYKIEYIKKNFPKFYYTGSEPFEQIIIWCEQHFGNDWIWNYQTLYFKHERDKTMFLLRWL